MPDDLIFLTVLETRVGRPASIGVTRHGEVTSAIAKDVVDAPRVWLGAINLEGDDQADRSVHGGPDKSVYCYPSEHSVEWATAGFTLPPGSVGENVVIAGQTEATVRIGDVFGWGEAQVQVCQPRSPCYKLAVHSGRKDIAVGMIDSGRTGWYVRTLVEGEVDTTGTMDLLERDDRSASVATTFAVMFPGRRAEADDPDAVRQVLRSPALAPEWLGYLRSRNPLA